MSQFFPTCIAEPGRDGQSNYNTIMSDFFRFSLKITRVTGKTFQSYYGFNTKATHIVLLGLQRKNKYLKKLCDNEVFRLGVKCQCASDFPTNLVPHSVLRNNVALKDRMKGAPDRGRRLPGLWTSTYDRQVTPLPDARLMTSFHVSATERNPPDLRPLLLELKSSWCPPAAAAAQPPCSSGITRLSVLARHFQVQQR